MTEDELICSVTSLRRISLRRQGLYCLKDTDNSRENSFVLRFPQVCKRSVVTTEVGVSQIELGAFESILSPIGNRGQLGCVM